MIALLIALATLTGAALTEVLHYVAHHRTGLTAALTVVCAWLATVIHLPLIAPHTGRHLPRRAPRKPKRTGVPA